MTDINEIKKILQKYIEVDYYENDVCGDLHYIRIKNHDINTSDWQVLYDWINERRY